MNRSPSLVALASVAVTLTMISGCGQIRDTLPSMERVIDVAKESAREPGTWIPLTAAAVIGVSGADDSISDWASDHTPVYGSQNTARSRSDDLRNTLILGMAITSVIAPTPAGDDTFLKRRVAANALGFGTQAVIVAAAKETFSRGRPNDRDNLSFPSGHSGSSFSSAVLIEQNLNETITKPWLRKSIKAGTIGTASAVAWARVEAQEHFPVDVLVSAGLTNFLSKVFYRSMVTEGRTVVPPIAIEASRKNFMVRLGHSF